MQFKRMLFLLMFGLFSMSVIPGHTVMAEGMHYTYEQTQFEKDIEEITDDLYFTQPLTEQGFEKLEEVEESKLNVGDIILRGEDRYAWIESSKVLDLSSKTEKEYVFSDSDEFYRYKKSDPQYKMPEDLQAEYKDDLMSITLPNGFKWNKNQILEEIGKQKFTLTYTPDNVLKYNTLSDLEVEVTVNKKKMNTIKPSDVFTVTYATDKKVSSIVLPTGWSFEDPDAILDTGTFSFKVKYSGDEEHYNYDCTEKDVKVNVVKAVLNFDKPSYLSAESGTKLSDVKLPTVKNGKLKWYEDVTVKESKNYKCMFIPDDVKHYEETGPFNIYVFATTKNNSNSSSGGTIDFESGNKDTDNSQNNTQKPSTPKPNTKPGTSNNNSTANSSNNTSDNTSNTNSNATNKTNQTTKPSSTSHYNTNTSGTTITSKVAKNKTVSDIIVKPQSVSSGTSEKKQVKTVKIRPNTPAEAATKNSSEKEKKEEKESKKTTQNESTKITPDTSKPATKGNETPTVSSNSSDTKETNTEQNKNTNTTVYVIFGALAVFLIAAGVVMFLRKKSINKIETANTEESSGQESENSSKTAE